MGASGAGKTSLLNMISDRISTKSGSKVGGHVFMNDLSLLDQTAFGQVGAYVMQDDILFDAFTPTEALTFAARLRLNISRE
jgi:ABC-type multidrug transport system ATPase subunit